MLQTDEKKLLQAQKSVFFYSSVIVNVEDNYQRQHKFSLEGWMSAICSDFALNLGNIREHVFSFLNPLSHSCCASAEDCDHLTNCVVKDVPKVMSRLSFSKVS